LSLDVMCQHGFFPFRLESYHRDMKVIIGINSLPFSSHGVIIGLEKGLSCQTIRRSYRTASW
jgi:hypothetical protein